MTYHNPYEHLPDTSEGFDLDPTTLEFWDDKVRSRAAFTDGEIDFSPGIMARPFQARALADSVAVNVRLRLEKQARQEDDEPPIVIKPEHFATVLDALKDAYGSNRVPGNSAMLSLYPGLIDALKPYMPGVPTPEEPLATVSDLSDRRTLMDPPSIPNDQQYSGGAEIAVWNHGA